MALTVFTATDCLRCNVLKRFLNERGISFDEKDIKSGGKADFTAFYAQHRTAVHRGKDGIEFPILVNGPEIRQGLGPSLAYLAAGKGLDGFVRASTRMHEWIDGLSLSGDDPAQTDALLSILRHLNACGMKTVLHTDGRQAAVLEKILEENLAHRLIMDVLGPPGIYREVFGNDRILQEIRASMRLVVRFREYRFRLVISGFPRKPGDGPAYGVLTPEDIGEAARMIQETTGSDRHPCVVAAGCWNGEKEDPEKPREAFSQGDLFPYRSRARRYQVFTEIEKKEGSPL